MLYYHYILSYNKLKQEKEMWIKEHGIKKTWDKKYETYAYVQDTGKYLTPVTWLQEKFNTKKEATEWLNKQFKEK